MSNDLFPRVEVQAKLAEGFVLPCDGCGGSGMELRGSPPQPQGGPCSACQGSGRQYPMRRQCPCIYADYDRRECYPCYRTGQHIESGGKMCQRCNGQDYVSNDAPDAIWNAVRAKGGTLRAWIDNGFIFVAECRLGSSRNEPQLDRADSMAEALELAVLKALDAAIAAIKEPAHAE